MINVPYKCLIITLHNIYFININMIILYTISKIFKNKLHLQSSFLLSVYLPFGLIYIFSLKFSISLWVRDCTLHLSPCESYLLGRGQHRLKIDWFLKNILKILKMRHLYGLLGILKTVLDRFNLFLSDRSLYFLKKK